MFILSKVSLNELNPIERNWCHAKKVVRQYVNGSIVLVREVVPTLLDAVSVEMMNKFFIELVEITKWPIELDAMEKMLK